jgi:pleiotropic regulator 1
MCAKLGDNGSLSFWDYKTGKPFQHLNDIPQSGSLDSEAVCSSV